jgi:hypothetical protein
MMTTLPQLSSHARCAGVASCSHQGLVVATPLHRRKVRLAATGSAGKSSSPRQQHLATSVIERPKSRSSSKPRGAPGAALPAHPPPPAQPPVADGQQQGSFIGNEPEQLKLDRLKDQLAALGIAIDESAEPGVWYTGVCPWCSGGQKNEQSLSVIIGEGQACCIGIAGATVAAGCCSCTALCMHPKP